MSRLTWTSLSLLLTLLVGFSAQAAQDTVTTYQYDPVGNLTNVISPLNSTTNPVNTTTSYDNLDRVKDILQPIPVSGQARPFSQVDHDGQDQLIWVNDPRNNQTTYNITGLGNTTGLTSPDTGAATSTYDEVGNLKTSTDARGITTVYSYDAQNRPTKADYPTGIDTLYTYDGGPTNTSPTNVGKLTRIDDESGVSTFRYLGALGQLDVKAQRIDMRPPQTGVQTAWLQAVKYVYGNSGVTRGKLLALIYPSGNRINYSYDAAGRIASLTLNPTNSNGIGYNTAVTTVLLSSIKYTPTGQFYSGLWGNHSTATPSPLIRSDDQDGRVSAYHLGNPSVNGTVRSLQYDPDSRVTAYSHTGSGIGSFAPANFNQSFSYDNLGRITGYSSLNGNQTYSYDATGNRIATGANNQTIDSFSNRLLKTTPTATNRVYDAAGNLLNDGSTQYTYSARGLLQSAKNLTTNAVTSYAYNGLGQRVMKLGSAETTINQYLYDEQGHLLGEYDYFGKPLQETVYLGDMPIAVLTQSIVRGTATQVLVDNTNTANVVAVGPWTAGTDTGANLQNFQSHVATTSADSFTWNLNLPAAGQYYILVRWTADTPATRTTAATYTATTAEGNSTRTVDQRFNGNSWVNIGLKTVTASNLLATVKLSASSLGSVSADAVLAQPAIITTNVNYLFADHLNTPRVITRASDNKIVWRWDKADPFGVIQPDENPSGLGAFKYNPRFPGQLYDAETGLYYNMHRHYSPTTGTYAQSDPIGLAGGINTYAYVGGNPVNLTDPLGLAPDDQFPTVDEPQAQQCGLKDDIKKRCKQLLKGAKSKARIFYLLMCMATGEEPGEQPEPPPSSPRPPITKPIDPKRPEPKPGPDPKPGPNPPDDLPPLPPTPPPI